MMLVLLVLPCQHRACNLWEYDPAEYKTLWELYGSSHEDIWKVLFKSGKSWPDSAEDRGYQLSRLASPVSYRYVCLSMFSWHIPREMLYHVFRNYPRNGRRRWGGYTVRPCCRRNRQDLF